MQEVLVKTHLIVKNVHDEYHMNWCGRIADAKPAINDGKPTFIIIGSKGRMELNTVDISEIERCAKMLTYPKGRSAIAVDTAQVFIKEVGGNEYLIGVLTHKHIKEFAPMYDKVNYL